MIPNAPAFGGSDTINQIITIAINNIEIVRALNTKNETYFYSKSSLTRTCKKRTLCYQMYFLTFLGHTTLEATGNNIEAKLSEK
jgi:hypothetical protein